MFAKEIGYGGHLLFNPKKLPYSEWNGLHYACFYHNDTKIIESFVKESVFDINEQTPQHGYTALHLVMLRHEILGSN